MKVYKKILDQLEKNPRGFQNELGEIAGYSNGGNFKRTLTENRDIEKLDGFVKVIEKLFPETSYELLVEYANELDPKKMTLKMLLEYATLYYKYDLVKIITDRLKESDKKESEEFAAVYDIHRQVQTKEISPLEGIKSLNAFIHCKIEIRTFAKIGIIYSYYMMRNINMINYGIEDIEKEIESIKNKFIRNSYTGRVFRMKVDVNLHTDEIGKLIESLFQIENAPDPTKTMVYLQVGNSYMTKNYDKAMFYFNKALECKTIKSEYEIKQSINFTSLLWDRLENFNSDGTASNELFYYIKSGNKGMAEKTLNKINFDELSVHGKAFNMFYRGLLFQEKSYFYKSVEYFIKAGEKFYKLLPIMELKKMGENDYIINVLCA